MKSLEMADGNLKKQAKLLNEWNDAGEKSVNLGSLVHYELEKYLINECGNYKEN